ncbi:MAG: hypothetical protein K0R84_2148, partial [Clostridia bacterium]|nr:hypothetical protein [Clostridia bacterium]
SSGIHIDSPVFNKLVETTTEIMKLSIIQSIMNEDSPKKIIKRPVDVKLNNLKIETNKTVGAVVADRYRKMTPEVKDIVRRNIRNIRAVEPKLISKAASSGLILANGPSILNQINVEKEFAFIANEQDFSNFIDDIRDLLERFGHGGHGGLGYGDNSEPDTPDTNPPDEPEPPIILNRGLKLKLHSVKCLDETNPEWIGSDEISMGGTTLDDKAVQSIINEFSVYNGFDDNDIKTYNPPMVLRQFNLDDVYPKDFSAFIALAEKDSGGFSKFIANLYDSVKIELQVIIIALAAKWGSQIGAEIGSSGGPIGAVIGAVIGAILGALIAWIVGALEDDIFPTQMATIHIPSGTTAFANGSLQSPVTGLYFEAHDGKYEVMYSWELMR